MWFFYAMKNKEEIVPKFTCEICGKKFETGEELDGHDAGHIVRPVSKNPLMAMMTLPDGISEGRWESADAFSEGVKELYEKYPHRTFQFVPFTYKNGYLTAMLAIAGPQNNLFSI